MSRMVKSMADRMVSLVVPRVRAQAACPYCPHHHAFFYVCCAGSSRAYLWKCQRQLNGSCRCNIIDFC